MDVHAAMGDERMLRRVMALLVAFAALAEQAATRSSPVRWFVLLILRHAETVAENFVFEATGMPPSAVDGIAAPGNGPDDALWLAARFYALAAAHCTLLPLGDQFDRRRGRRALTSGRVAPGFDRRHWTSKPNDTS